MVEQGIQGITDDIVREALNCTWTEIHKNTKPVILDFYYELQEYMSHDAINVIPGLEDDHDDATI